MRDWHFEHMQKTILKYVSGLTENEKQSSWKVKQHRRYGGNLPNVRRNIDFEYSTWCYKRRSLQIFRLDPK